MRRISEKAVSQSFRFTRIGISGAWLLFLYPCLLWAVVGTLSAYGFQDKVKAVKDQDGNPLLTIPAVVRRADKLREIAVHENAIETRLAREKDGRKRAETKRQQIKEKLTKTDAEVNQLESESNAQSHSPGSIQGQDPAVSRSGLKVEKRNQAEDPPTLNDLKKRQRELSDEAKLTFDEYHRINSAIESTAKELSDIRNEAIELTEQLKVGDFVSELEYMSFLGFKHFATMPSQLLTLILTLSMGALGSLIFITHDHFGTNAEKPFSWYLFRPFLGMVTAVAVFVFAKAGQLTISDASLSGNVSENLNPYFISFLGVISGLVSEQATERIRAAGATVFRADGTEQKTSERWAVGLEGEMERQQKTVADLMPFLDVSEVVIEDWVAERQPVPVDAQRIIAGWLGISKRRLFTDLPPSLAQAEPQTTEPNTGLTPKAQRPKDK